MQLNNLEEERIESIKVAGLSAFTGSIASAPVKASALYASNGFVKSSALALAQWEIAVLAVQLALFGIIYRCIVRCDDNTNLRQGAVAGFALCRALASLPVSSNWNADTWVQLGVYFGEGALAFGCAASAIEWVWDQGLAFPLGGVGLPTDYDDRNFYSRPRNYDTRSFDRGYVRPTSRTYGGSSTRGGNYNYNRYNNNRNMMPSSASFDQRSQFVGARNFGPFGRRGRGYRVGDDPQYYRDGSSIAGQTTREPMQTISDRVRR